MTRRMFSICLVAALVQFVPAVSLPALSSTTPTARTNFLAQSKAPRPSGQWSMFMNGPQRQGRGRIAFVDEGGNVFVLNPDGAVSWEFETGTSFASPSSSPAIGWDGTIYTGIGRTVYAFHPDGSIRWTYSLARRTLTGPVGVKPD